MQVKSSLLAIGCLCASLVIAHAQGSLILTPSSVNLTIGPYTDRADFTFPTPAVSLANYGGMRVTFSAPAGYAWRFDPSVTPYMACYLLYGAAPTPDQIGYGGSLYSFDFMSGMASTVSTPLASNSDKSWDSETGFGFDVHFYFGGAVEFTSVTVSEAHYVSQAMYQRQLTLSPFDHAYLDGSSGQLDGGLTLVPIPEPGFAALAFLGVLVAIVRSSDCRKRPDV